MPVRQALNAVYAHMVAQMDQKERKRFIDDLYGFTELNQAADHALRDVRGLDETLTGSGDR